MTTTSRGPPTKTKKNLWAYAYDITLPTAQTELETIQELLEEGHTEALAGARTWAGRVVVEPQVTRILVVSDSPEQNHKVNRRIEAALKLLKAAFRITLPMAVVDDVDVRLLNGDPPAKPS